MGRGRKTLKVQLEGVGPVIPGRPPPAPDGLEPDVADVWRALAARMPVDWFTPETFPVLTELCRHVVYAREIAAQIAAVRAKFVAEGKDILTDPRCCQVLGTLKQQHATQSDRIARLSTKLRLTLTSRYDERAADRQVRNHAVSIVPKTSPANAPATTWEDWGPH